MQFKGLYTALVTPFDANENVNEAVLRDHIRFQIQAGVDGIVVLGTTGETPTLSSIEQEKVIQIAIEEGKHKIAIVAGTGSNSTEETIKKTLKAQEMGVDGALVVTPYYNKPTQEGIYRHFKALVDAVDLPVIVYNIQGRTGQNIQIDTLKRLANFPTIVGVKESSGHIIQIMETIEEISRHRKDFSVLSGDDNLTLPVMALGGHGVVSVISNLLPAKMQALVQSAAKGDFVVARHWHHYLWQIVKAIFLETNPVPIKTAMTLCGIPVGRCRLPLCEMQPENIEALRRALETVEMEFEISLKTR